VTYLVDCKADLKAEDQFKNNCLNDALRHKYRLEKTIYLTLTSFDICVTNRHDNVAKFLREKGATLVMLGNAGGVLMCKVGPWLSLKVNSISFEEPILPWSHFSS
jgi:hypothetical protein